VNDENDKIEIKSVGSLQSDPTADCRPWTSDLKKNAMKTKNFKTLILAICVIVFSITTNAQLPDFTRVDTGAITVIPGGHLSSACFDMDNDGDLDLLCSNSGKGTNRHFSIYTNERNGFYVKTPVFVDGPYDYNLSSIGDIDNDGDVDLLAGFPSSYLGVYTNDGYGNYQEDTVIQFAHSTFYYSLLDLNSDGFLDALSIDKYGCVTYNDGNGAFLENENIGVLHDPDNIMLHSISWGDVDDDGDFDAYGGYSGDNPGDGNLSKNVCFINNGDGTFIKFDETSVIVDDPNAENACVNWVDYDNDGDMDLYVLNFTLDTIDGPLNALYENMGEMQFTKHVFEDEMYRNSFTNSSVWGDLDNDADLDLYVSIENNVFPWGGDTSATPYNLIFLNDGDGGFTNILDHPLALEDSHTALLLDQDNDGNLDVLLTRYSWSMEGHNNLFVNEGNDNSWIILTCEGTTSNRSAIGTRIYAKTFANGKYITQTREITPINGHLAYANLRVHFGLAEANVIDTLLIRWPSGNIDTYFDVKANQFYRAIEDNELGIDFAATNYIQCSPPIPDQELTSVDETITIDLNDYYKFITGDTVPVIEGDTMFFKIFNNENTNVVTATINGNILTLESGIENGDSKIQLIDSTSIAKRMDHFTVSRLVDVVNIPEKQNITAYPNPFNSSIVIEYELKNSETVKITIYNPLGKQIKTIEKKQSQGKQQVVWDAEGLPAGIYLCVLKTDKGIVSTRLIKLQE